MPDKVLAARRLSAALGRSFSADDIQHVLGEDESFLILNDDSTITLAGGNAAYIGNDQWVKNGKPWDLDTTGDKVRALAPSA